MPRIDQWSLLALLRFALAAIVAVNHLADFVPLGLLTPIPYFGAFEAILGFLLISGYSVGSSYLKAPQGFMRRRLLRLYPIYLAAILLAFVITPAPPTLPFIAVLAANVLFLNQALTTVSFVGPAWSLSLEFWLYCLIPWFDRRSDRQLRGIVYASFAAYALYTAARTLFHLPYYSGVGFGLNLILLAFAWICGFRLAKSPPLRPAILRDTAILFGAHIALAAAIQFGFRWKHRMIGTFVVEDVLHFAAQAATLLGVWGCFRYLIFRPAGGSLRKSMAMRILGDISYPWYLIHIALFTLAMRWRERNPYVMLALSIVVAWLLYQLVDFYSRRRERLPLVAAATT